MKSLEILLNQSGALKPGGVLEGTVMWELESPAKKITINFFWFLEKYGDVEETNIISSLEAENIQPHGYKNFAFDIPRQPYSFSGNLFSIKWAVECVVDKDSVVQDLVVSNNGQEIEAGEPDFNHPLYKMIDNLRKNR